MYIAETNTTFRSERAFSIVLAEEIAKMEADSVLGNPCKILYVDTKASAIEKSPVIGKTYTPIETKMSCPTRSVEVTMFLAYEDNLGLTNVCTVDTEIRLLKNDRKWYCHFVNIRVASNGKAELTRECIYIDGTINGTIKNRNAGSKQLWELINIQPT